MSVKIIQADDLLELLSKPELLEIIDVRDPSELAAVSLPGAKNIPLPQVPDRLFEIDWSKNVVFVCRSGTRSHVIAKVVSTQGYSLANLDGGLYALFRTDPSSLRIASPEQARYYFS